MDSHFHVAHLVDTVNNHFLEITFTQKLYEVSYLYQDFFFQVMCLITALPSIHHGVFLLQLR